MNKDYKELAQRLKEYSYSRKGEIAKLTYDAAVAIDVLEGACAYQEGRIRELEAENENLRDDGR